MNRFAGLVALGAFVATAAAQTPVQVRLDAGTFRYTDDQTLVEVYLSFGAETLPFEPTADGFAAEVPVRVQLLPSSSGAPAGVEPTAVYDQTIPFQYLMADTTSLQSGQVFVEQVRLAAVPGEYELDIEVSPAGRSQLRLARDLRVPSYNSEFTMVSALQLASGIQQATGGSDALTKSGLTIRPNPDAFYGGNQGAVQYYAEVYGPPAQTDEYTLLTFLAETDGGAALPGTERRTQRAVKPVDVVASQMDISTLPSGIYYLRFVVLDASNQSAAEQSKRFYVINPDVERPEIGPDLLTYEETLFAAMDSEELQLNIQHALVIASNRERSSLVRPQSDEDRRRALALFWTNRDQDGLPNQNEARRAFYERLGVVNDRYREVGIPAYETDRGRIYLTYGAPVQIERRVFEANMHPHEIWVYDNIPGEGRGQFVFADRFSSDRYELIHSNVSGEVSMPSWRTELMQ